MRGSLVNSRARVRSACLLAVLGVGVGAASGEIAVAAFPKGPLRDVLAAVLLDDLRCLASIEHGLHLHGFLHGFDGNAGGNLLGDVELAQAARGGGGLFERVGFLQVGPLALGGGSVGGEGFLAFASAGEVGRDARGFEEVVIGRSVIELDVSAIVEGRELHHVVEMLRSGRREG